MTQSTEYGRGTAAPGGPRPGWWARHWKWAVPVGVTALVVVVCGGAFVALVFGALHMLRSSDVHALAVARANDHPALRRELGEPIEPGRLVTGNINISNGRGSAALVVPVNGPLGDADLEVDGDRTAGEWRLVRLEAVLADGRRLDLLVAPEPTGPMQLLLE